MPKDILHTALDVGTSKVSTIVSRLQADGTPELMGVGFSPSEGMRKGVVVNIQEAQEAIRGSVAEAARSAGVPSQSAYIGTSDSQVDIFPRWGSLRSVVHNTPLTHSEIDRAVEAAFPAELPPEKQVLHQIPRLYAVDGLKGIRNPVGMHALRLDVETLCIVSATAPIQNLVHAAEGVGLQSRGVVFSALAAGEATLTRDEKEMGVVLVEIGGGTTTVALFQQGTLWNTAVLPVGGHQFTTDLAVALNTPYDIAEGVKIHHGQANMDGIGDDHVELQAFGDRRTVRVERREICRFLHDRAEELCRLVQIKVGDFGFPSMPPAGVVLSGGGATLRGIDRVARRVFGSPVRVGSPSGLDALPQGMDSPAYNASVGTLLWGIRNLASQNVGARSDRRAVRSNGHARANGHAGAGGGPLSWLKERVKGAAL